MSKFDNWADNTYLGFKMFLTSLLLIFMENHNPLPRGLREGTYRCKDRVGLAYYPYFKPANGFQATDPNQTILALAW